MRFREPFVGHIVFNLLTHKATRLNPMDLN